MLNIAMYHNYCALLFDSLKIVVPIELLGTLALAWLGRKKFSPDHKTLTDFMGNEHTRSLALVTLLIVTPFTVGGILGYNVMADTSPPQVITMQVVSKSHTLTPNMEDKWTIDAETLDGQIHLTFYISESSYRELEVGSLFQATVHKGALGYQWASPSVK